jgi:hypothetical protein
MATCIVTDDRVFVHLALDDATIERNAESFALLEGASLEVEEFLKECLEKQQEEPNLASKMPPWTKGKMINVASYMDFPLGPDIEK